MQLRVLGPVQATHDGENVALGGPRQRAVLALLVAFANKPISSDRLIDEIWGEEPPPQARNSLQAMISNLRKALLPDERFAIERNGRSYELVSPEDGIDALLFTARIDSARRLLSADLDAGIGELASALELWQGTPYSDVDEAETLRADAARLAELRLRALETRFEAELSAGRAADTVGELEHLVDLEPLREGLYRLLMEALVASGRQAEALRVAGRLRQTLAAELGIDPSPELLDYEQQILDQTTTSREPADRTMANPYRGLESFTEADADRFYGRDKLTDLLLDRMQEDLDGFRLLAVVGASGSGKSSVVRAGLIPALRHGAIRGSENWVVVQMLPGVSPLRELEAALLRVAVNPPATLLEQLARDDLGLRDAAERILPDNESELLVMIDQFEEMFTTADPDESSQLIDAIVGAVNADDSRVRVVITLRADFYDRPLSHPGLAPLLAKRMETVVAMTPDELSEAIVGPAEQAGVTVEPGLVGAIVADSTGQPGALPMVQYALTELYENRADATMSLDEYRDMGGVRGAIRQRAESLYEAYGPDDQHRIRRLMLQLVRLGQGDEHSRRRVEYGLLDGDFGGELIDALTAARLLAVDQDAATERSTVEVAHEALLREWPRFNSWIDESLDDLRTVRRLHNAAVDWEEADRPDDYLLAGGRLAGLDDWIARSQMSLGSPEAEFLEVSIAARDAAEAARTRKRRRITTLVASLSAVVLVTASVIVVGTIQGAGQRALDEARQLALSSAAASDTDTQLALLLAIEAVEVEPVPEALDALHDAIDRQRIVSDLGIGGGVAAFVGNSTVAMLEKNGTIGIYDVSAPTPTKLDQLGEPGWIPVAYVNPEIPPWENRRPQLRASGDGVIVVGAVDGSIYVADQQRRWQPWSARIGAFAPSVALTRDGTLVAARAWTTTDTGDVSTTGAIFESSTRHILQHLDGAGEPGLAFTPGPVPRLITETVEQGQTNPDFTRYQQLHPEKGDPLGTSFDFAISDNDGGVIAASARNAYSPGRSAAGYGVVGAALETGLQARVVGSHDEPIWDLALDGSGSQLASAGGDGRVRVSNTEVVTAPYTLPVFAVDVDLNSAGNQLLTVGAEGHARVWDISRAGTAEIYGATPAVPDFGAARVFVRFRGDSSEFVQFVTGGTGATTLTDADSRAASDQLLDASDAVTISPDGGRLAIARNGVLTLIDLDSGMRETFGEFLEADLRSIAFSPDGEFVSVLWQLGAIDHQITMFELATRRMAVVEAPAITSLRYDGSGRVHGFTHFSNVSIWEWLGNSAPTSVGSYSVSPGSAAELSGNIAIVANRTGLWAAVDANTGNTLVASEIRHQRAILAIAIDEESHVVATGDMDGVIRVWDLDTGDHLYRLADMVDPISSMSFSHDGSMLVAATSGAVEVFALDTERLLEIAGSRLLRGLTPDECQQYVGTEDCS